eukprot:c24251_g6_i1 orf=144-1022(+)
MYSCSWLSRHLCLHYRNLTSCTILPPTQRFTSYIPEPHNTEQQRTQNTLNYFIHECNHTRDISSGRDLHCRTICSSLNLVSILGDHFIRMFSTIGSLFEASLVFCVVEKPSVYTWHAVISAHVMLGEHDMALDLYGIMQQEGICSGRVTYLCILKACGNARTSWQGMLAHHQILSCGVDTDVVMGSTLIDMYSKCGALKEAQYVLDYTTDRNVVSYNALTTGCAQHGQWFLVFKICMEMESEGIKPNKVTYSSLLKACGGIGAVYEGKLIHNHIIIDGCHTDSVIVTSLVDM